MISYIQSSYEYQDLLNIITDKEMIYADSFSLTSCYNLDEEEGVNGLLKKTNGMGVYCIDEMMEKNYLPYSDNMIILLSMIDGEDFLEKYFIRFLTKFENTPKKIKLCCGIRKQTLFALILQLEKKIKQSFPKMEIIYIHAPFLLFQNMVENEMVLLKESKQEHLLINEYLMNRKISIEEIYPLGRSRSVEKAKTLAKTIEKEKPEENFEKYNLVFIDRMCDISAVSLHNLSPIQRVVDSLPFKEINERLIPTNKKNVFFQDLISNQNPQKVFSLVSEKLAKMDLQDKEKKEKKERPSLNLVKQNLGKLDSLTKLKNNESLDLIDLLLDSHQDSKWEEMMSVEKIMVMSSSSTTLSRGSASQQIYQMIPKFSLQSVLLLLVTSSALFQENLDLDLIFKQLESQNVKDSKYLLSCKSLLIRFLDYIKDARNSIDLYSSLLNKSSNSAVYVSLVERVFSDLLSPKTESFLSQISLKTKKPSNTLTSYLFSFTSSTKQESVNNFVFYFDGGFTFQEYQSLKSKISSLNCNSKIIFISNRFASKKYLLSLLEPK